MTMWQEVLQQDDKNNLGNLVDGWVHVWLQVCIFPKIPDVEPNKTADVTIKVDHEFSLL